MEINSNESCHGVPGTGVLETGRVLSLGVLTSSFSFISLAGSGLSISTGLGSSFFTTSDIVGWTG